MNNSAAFPTTNDTVSLIEDGSQGRPIDFYLILIVDDNADVHEATRLTLKNSRINGRRIELLDAYSGDEAKRFIEHGIPFDLVLLDMVMETEDAGMKVANSIWFDEFILKSSITRSRLIDVLTRRLTEGGEEASTPL